MPDPKVTTPLPVKKTRKVTAWHPLKIPFIHPKKNLLCIISLFRNNIGIVSRTPVKRVVERNSPAYVKYQSISCSKDLHQCFKVARCPKHLKRGNRQGLISRLMMPFVGLVNPMSWPSHFSCFESLTLLRSFQKLHLVLAVYRSLIAWQSCNEKQAFFLVLSFVRMLTTEQQKPLTTAEPFDFTKRLLPLGNIEHLSILF